MGYSRKEDPALSDLMVMWDAANSGYKLTPLTSVESLFATSETTTTVKEADSQYSAPATGATIVLTDSATDKHLIITPVVTLAALTLTLPAITRDKQTILVNCTQVITTLTIDGNGAAAVNGAPATLAANDFFALKYDSTMDSWYRVA